MSKYRPVDVRLWNDRKFASLSEGARMLWVFFLTAPASATIAIPGIVIGGDASLAEQLGWPVERYRERFQELLEKGLAVRSEGRLVWLPNASKYQPPSNPNMVKAWAKCWDDIPEYDLKHDIWQALKIACKSWSRLFAELFVEPLRDGFSNGSTNGSGNGSTQKQYQDQYQKQEQKQDLDQTPIVPKGDVTQFDAFADRVDAAVGEVGSQRAKPVRDRRRKPKATEPNELEQAAAERVLAKLGSYNGVTYESGTENTQLVIERIRAGISERDLKIVAGYCALEKGWKDDPQWGQYLRPSTLYGPKTIWKYLDPARTWFAKLEADERAQAPVNGTSLEAETEPDWMQSLGGES